MPFQSSSKKPTSPEMKEWARGVVRKILVILGDLSRYRTEFEPKQAAGVTTNQFIFLPIFLPATDCGLQYFGKNMQMYRYSVYRFAGDSALSHHKYAISFQGTGFLAILNLNKNIKKFTVLGLIDNFSIFSSNRKCHLARLLLQLVWVHTSFF